MIILVLVAEVKYPSSNNTYLSANSYAIEKDDMGALEKSTEDFKAKVQTGGFKIVNFLIYIVPDEQLKMI